MVSQIRFIQLYVMRGGLLPEMISVQLLLNLFHNVVADKLLRFLVLKDIAATVKANARDAFHVILYCMQKIFYGLTVSLVRNLMHARF